MLPVVIDNVVLDERGFTGRANMNTVPAVVVDGVVINLTVGRSVMADHDPIRLVINYIVFGPVAVA